MGVGEYLPAGKGVLRRCLFLLEDPPGVHNAGILFFREHLEHILILLMRKYVISAVPGISVTCPVL